MFRDSHKHQQCCGVRAGGPFHIKRARRTWKWKASWRETAIADVQKNEHKSSAIFFNFFFYDIMLGMKSNALGCRYSPCATSHQAITWGGFASSQAFGVLSCPALHTSIHSLKSTPDMVNLFTLNNSQALHHSLAAALRKCTLMHWPFWEISTLTNTQPALSGPVLLQGPAAIVNIWR